MESEQATGEVVAPSEGFPIGECAGCERVVLAHLWFDEADVESHRCIHCDGELSDLRWITKGRLGEFGYAVQEAARGCGSGGCGSGRCGRR